MSVEPMIEYLPARNEVLHAYSDHARVRRVFGTNGDVGLEEGVRRMAAWARIVGARKTREFDGIEVTRNLPAGWA